MSTIARDLIREAIDLREDVALPVPNILDFKKK